MNHDPTLSTPQLRAAHALAVLCRHPWSRLSEAAALDANRDGGVSGLAQALEGVMQPERLRRGERLAPHVDADGQVHERGQCGGCVTWVIGEDGTVTLSAHREPNVAGLQALARENSGETLLLRDALASPRLTTVASVTVPADDHEAGMFWLGDPTMPRLDGGLGALPQHISALRACVQALTPLSPRAAADADAWLAAQEDACQRTERAEHSERLFSVLADGPEAQLLRDAAEAFGEQAARLEREDAVNAAVEALFTAESNPHDMVALAEGLLQRARLAAQVAQSSGGETALTRP